MVKINDCPVIEQITTQLGANISDVSFEISLDGGEIKLGAEHFALKSVNENDSEIIISGQWRDFEILWVFRSWNGGYWVTLQLHSSYPLQCDAITPLKLIYRPYSGIEIPLEHWWLPGRGSGFEREGMSRVSDLKGDEHDSLLIGAFPDNENNGLFVGTGIPQHHVHKYAVKHKGEEALSLVCMTSFVEGMRESKELVSEATWLCVSKCAKEAIETYWSHIPENHPVAQPPVGWSSWDYYFRTVTLEDMVENMEAIRADPVLSQHVNYIVVDDGWHHVDGEWYPNYRFPGGTARLADEIKKRGFVPGIWTAPILVDTLSITAMRHGDFLIKNTYGDPQISEVSNRYMVDPTHPKGQTYLKEIYTRLFNEGFRFFKLDYVSVLLGAERFYAQDKGPYDVLRDLFNLVRTCVTDASHILGCSLPAECGPGYADSGRINIDIHNHWTHIKWAAESHQLANNMHNRIWCNDPDFLVVRGPDTSTEGIHNVMNPAANNPDPPRWRRGPDFNLIEAQTWATLVALSGGSVFLGDRISTLNTAGKALLYKIIQPFGVSALALDLCKNDHARYWFQQRGNEARLGVINWSDQPQTLHFSFADYGLKVPTAVKEFWQEQEWQIMNDVLSIDLEAHGSVLLCWDY